MRAIGIVLLAAGLAASLASGAAAAAGDLRFVVIGDTRPKFASEDFRIFTGLIARINQRQPALVVNLGDLIYGYGVLSKEKQCPAGAATPSCPCISSSC
jgi:hypothetical protein